jgi:multiple sugar transport system permease protein
MLKEVELYGPTLLRYAVFGAGILALSYAVYLFLRYVARRRSETASGYALITPWVVGFAVFTIFPIGASLYLSFTDYNLFQPPNFIGLDNYVRMLTEDPNFWPSMRLTLLYAAISVPLGIAGSMITAVALAQDVRGIGFWRTLYYLPAVLPAAATALLWRWMFNPDSGLINSVLAPFLLLVGAQPPGWFSDPELVLPSYIIISFWGVFGANTVIMLAALKGVPPHLYESAQIDGAGILRRFWSITVPMVSPTVFYQVVLGIIGAIQIFTVPLFIRTPREAGQFLQVGVYQQAFTFSKMGYASAMGWVMLVIILVLTLLVFKTSSAWVYYEAERKR